MILSRRRELALTVVFVPQIFAIFTYIIYILGTLTTLSAVNIFETPIGVNILELTKASVEIVLNEIL